MVHRFNRRRDDEELGAPMEGRRVGLTLGGQTIDRSLMGEVPAAEAGVEVACGPLS